MTRTDIINKVESLEGKELTRDDYYELGKMHRELPLCLRDWNWLKEITGWKGTANSYRCYVKSRLKRENELPISTSDDAIESADEDRST